MGLPHQVAGSVQKIRFILLDVDGVLTDGRVGLLPDGGEIKYFSIYDGLAIRLAQRVGIEVGFISGRRSQEVGVRAKELEVEVVIQNTGVNGFWLRYHNYFQGRLLRHGIPFRKLALFRLRKGEYERIDENHWSNFDMEIHEHPILEGTVGEINAPIVHRDYKGMHRYLARHNEYSSWEAQRFLDLKRKGPKAFEQLTPRQRKKYISLDKWWWAPSYFLVNYFLRLGFLDGREGFVYSVLKASYFFEIRCKIKEAEKLHK